MDHRAIILDGITVQHVGEILYDSPITAPIRALCSDSYRRCLEDFAFGVLFGESLTLSGRMPPVGDTTPGAVLMREPTISDFIVEVQPAEPDQTLDLLNNSSLGLSVRRDMGGLAHLDELDLGPFVDFFVREVRAYLGDHESLSEEGLAPEAYVFSTSVRQSHYITDRALQDLIKKEFIDDILIRLGPTLNRPLASSALREFISRALLTHVANYWTFDFAVEDQPHGSARLPHVTRSLIRRKTDQSQLDQTTENRIRRLVYNGIVPHALLWVIGLARRRGAFMDALRESRDSQTFREIRRYLTELVAQLGNGDRNDADKLLAEIARKSTSVSTQRDDWQLSVPIVGGFTVDGRALDAVSRRTNPGKYYLRQLIRTSSYTSESDYIRRLGQMFPELGVKS